MGKPVKLLKLAKFYWLVFGVIHSIIMIVQYDFSIKPRRTSGLVNFSNRPDLVLAKDSSHFCVMIEAHPYPVYYAVEFQLVGGY
jgi:hypothetical protein